MNGATGIRSVMLALLAVLDAPHAAADVVTMPTLVFQGAAKTAAPVVTAAPLVFQGAESAAPAIVTTAPLVFAGAAGVLGAPPSLLEYIDVPTEPRSSQYLSLESAGIAQDQPLRLQYTGLPPQQGIIGLIYVGAAAPRLLGWGSTRPDRPDGVYERAAGSLASFTGPWKACIGFRPAMSAAVADPAAYSDCVDFVLAGRGSLGARPTVSFPGDEFRAGREIRLEYSAMPPVSSRLAIVPEGGTRPVVNHYTSGRASGTWIFRIAAPGRYELQVTYTGDAVRARMPLEITP